MLEVMSGKLMEGTKRTMDTSEFLAFSCLPNLYFAEPTSLSSAEPVGRSSFGNEKGRQEPAQRVEQGYAPSRSTRQNNADYSRDENGLNYDPNDQSFTNDVTNRPNYPTQTFYRKCFLFGFQAASAAGTSAAFGLVVVLAIMSHIYRRISPFHKDPPRPPVEKDWEERISGERFSGRAQYYAEYFGYECEDLDVETEDGFVLRVHHLISKKHEKREFLSNTSSRSLRA